MAKITIKKQKELEHQFMIRMQELALKPKNNAYIIAQSHFFKGAMLATEDVQFWKDCINDGKSIYVERNKLNK